MEALLAAAKALLGAVDTLIKYTDTRRAKLAAYLEACIAVIDDIVKTVTATALPDEQTSAFLYGSCEQLSVLGEKFEDVADSRMPSAEVDEVRRKLSGAHLARALLSTLNRHDAAARTMALNDLSKAAGALRGVVAALKAR